MVGPGSVPLCTRARSVRWSAVPRMLRTVVTPLARYSGRSRSPPSAGRFMWMCMSTSPGTIHFPRPSTRVAPGGTRIRPAGPTCVMRAPRTNTVWFSSTRSPGPSIGSTDAPTMASVGASPEGASGRGAQAATRASESRTRERMSGPNRGGGMNLSPPSTRRDGVWFVRTRYRTSLITPRWLPSGSRRKNIHSSWSGMRAIMCGASSVCTPAAWSDAYAAWMSSTL